MPSVYPKDPPWYMCFECQRVVPRDKGYPFRWTKTWTSTGEEAWLCAMCTASAPFHWQLWRPHVEDVWHPYI